MLLMPLSKKGKGERAPLRPLGSSGLPPFASPREIRAGLREEGRPWTARDRILPRHTTESPRRQGLSRRRLVRRNQQDRRSQDGALTERAEGPPSHTGMSVDHALHLARVAKQELVAATAEEQQIYRQLCQTNEKLASAHIKLERLEKIQGHQSRHQIPPSPPQGKARANSRSGRKRNRINKASESDPGQAKADTSLSASELRAAINSASAGPAEGADAIWQQNNTRMSGNSVEMTAQKEVLVLGLEACAAFDTEAAPEQSLAARVDKLAENLPGAAKEVLASFHQREVRALEGALRLKSRCAKVFGWYLGGGDRGPLRARVEELEKQNNELRRQLQNKGSQSHASDREAQAMDQQQEWAPETSMDELRFTMPKLEGPQFSAEKKPMHEGWSVNAADFGDSNWSDISMGHQKAEQGAPAIPSDSSNRSRDIPSNESEQSHASTLKQGAFASTSEGVVLHPQLETDALNQSPKGAEPSHQGLDTTEGSEGQSLSSTGQPDSDKIVGAIGHDSPTVTRKYACAPAGENHERHLIQQDMETKQKMSALEQQLQVARQRLEVLEQENLDLARNLSGVQEKEVATSEDSPDPETLKNVIKELGDALAKKEEEVGGLVHNLEAAAQEMQQVAQQKRMLEEQNENQAEEVQKLQDNLQAIQEQISTTKTPDVRGPTTDGLPGNLAADSNLVVHLEEQLGAAKAKLTQADAELAQLREEVAKGQSQEQIQLAEERAREAEEQAAKLSEELDRMVLDKVRETQQESQNSQKKLENEIVVLCHNYGSALKREGKTEAAITQFQKALQTQISLTGERSVEIVPILVNMGATHFSAGNPKDALALFQLGFDIRAEKLGKDDKSTVQVQRWVMKCQTTIANGGAGAAAGSFSPLGVRSGNSSPGVPLSRIGSAQELTVSRDGSHQDLIGGVSSQEMTGGVSSQQSMPVEQPEKSIDDQRSKEGVKQARTEIVTGATDAASPDDSIDSTTDTASSFHGSVQGSTSLQVSRDQGESRDDSDHIEP